MDITNLHLPYALPTALLLAALTVKSPAFMRSWRRHDARVTWFVMLSASAVFLSVAPVSLHKINTITGVPNIAAPWTYSLLVSFCGSCMAMIITWRERPTDRRRRRIRWVWGVHAGIIVALWATFLMADVPDERIYDLDTYYANTPWMREHIVLYLLAYLTSTLMAAWLIYTWISDVTGWLKAGLICLQAGYALGVVFDIAKLVAISARWAGTNWDALSVNVAPPFAILGASLVGIGFLLPVAGPFLQQWPREQVTYWILQPLERRIRRDAPSLTQARVSRWDPLDIRMIQRRQRIFDALVRIAPYYNHDLYLKAFEAARTKKYRESRARGIAGAIALRSALDSFSRGKPSGPGSPPAQVDDEVTDHLVSISWALLRSRSVDDIRRRVTTESVTAHV
ncbi:MAB_1171c family putative transporter [Streptomyces sp. NPDC002553]|uniref:MAB_1171c family putative transporter n=1 Tax=Streptomyces sp. NPDC002553 TaxID=3154417 RepID=UPI003330280B